MHTMKCPACEEGYQTFSAQANIQIHVRNKAKVEALKHYLGVGTTTKHVDFMKENMEIVQQEKITFKF